MFQCVSWQENAIICYSVPANGSIFMINSKNYGKLWLNTIKEDGEIVYDDKFSSASLKYTHVTAEWYEVQYDKDENIIANIQPNNGETALHPFVHSRYGRSNITIKKVRRI